VHRIPAWQRSMCHFRWCSRTGCRCRFP